MVDDLFALKIFYSGWNLYK